MDVGQRASQVGVRCMVMRGGSSKGAYFVADDLPADPDERDELLLRIMGSPDDRQIDGIGGAHPLTSKVAVVSTSTDEPGTIDYLFLQVVVDEAVVSAKQNCGNILAGVAPFALERGLITAASAGGGTPAGGGPAGADGESSMTTRIRMLNSDSVAEATFAVAGGLPVYEGDTSISGVPGTAAAVRLDFEGLAGGTCGALLPTGSPVDEVDGIGVTCIDNGMPVVVLRAADLGVTGYESPTELEANAELRAQLERIRLTVGPKMALGSALELETATVPKLTLVAPPRHGGDLSTRTFIPHRCHDAIGVLGAVSVATAALLPGTPANEVLMGSAGASGGAPAASSPRSGGPSGESHRVDRILVLEHPTGTFDAAVTIDHATDPPTVKRAGILRTARKLMDGMVFPRP